MGNIVSSTVVTVGGAGWVMGLSKLDNFLGYRNV